jgi:hypothetical protein
MADTRKFKCREHGGWVVMPIRRGRPPVRCTDEFQCDAIKVEKPVTRAESVAKLTHDRHLRKPKVTATALNGSRSEPKPRSTSGGKAASIAQAQRAREELEPLGWTVSGKAWEIEEGLGYATVTAARNDELLTLTWLNGTIQHQQYSLWSIDKPSANGKPESNLPFDPDEVPDTELAQLLVGTKVTWFNRLARSNESAICGKDTLTIEHILTGTGDETPGERIIKFVDAAGQGFRAFRLDQLIKVG